MVNCWKSNGMLQTQTFGAMHKFIKSNEDITWVSLQNLKLQPRDQQHTYSLWDHQILESI